MAKYPDEAPVFEIDGEHHECRPGMMENGALNGCITAVDQNFNGCASRPYLYEDFPGKPLTRAARELLAWVRQ